MSTPIEFGDIVISAGKSKKRGSLALAGSTLSEAKFVFHSKAPKPVEIKLEEIQAIYWMEVGKGVSEGGFVVKLALAAGKAYVKFSGFNASAYNPLQNWLLSSGKSLIIEKVSTRGANWGTVKVSDHRLLFEDKEGLVLFDLPTNQIAQTVFQGKNDIAIELATDDDPKSVLGQMETLCEIRIFVPNEEREGGEGAASADGDDVKMKTEGGEEKADGEDKDGEEGDEDEEETEEETAAQLLAKDIMSRVGADDKTVQPIARFNVMFQSPRGKYNIDMYQSYMKLASKTFQYKVLYKYVQQMFLFPNPQTASHFFIIALNPPIRQGRTPHQFLLIQFEDRDMVEEKFNVDEKTCVEQYKNIIQPQMSGHRYDVMTRVFKALTERKVLIPGANFRSTIGGACVRCNLKANDGYLYCMEKSFFFVKKPLMYIRHAEIAEVSFERLSSGSSGSRSFDLRIVTNEEKNNEHIFSGIQRDEYQNLFDFLKDKKLNMTSQFEGSMTTGASGRIRTATNYDEEHDPHMARIQDEAGSDDSEEDSDFDGEQSSSESSESGSDIGSEASDDSDAPSTKKGKKSSSRKNASSGDEGEDEDGDKKKKGGTKRKRGDKDAEKKPRKPVAKSAYFHYLDYARPKYYQDNPSSKETAVAVTGILAAQWRALSTEEKQPFKEMADESKAKLAAERAASGDVSDDDKPKKKRSSSSKDGKPKKPPTPQALWMTQRKKELKAEEPELKGNELKSKLSEEWKSLAEDKRQVWVEKILALKKQYKIDIDEWNKTHPQEDAGDDAMDDGEGDGEEDEEAAAARKKAKKEAKKAKKEAKKAKKEAKKAKKAKKAKERDGGGDASSGDEDMAPADDDTQVKMEE